MRVFHQFAAPLLLKNPRLLPLWTRALIPTKEFTIMSSGFTLSSSVYGEKHSLSMMTSFNNSRWCNPTYTLHGMYTTHVDTHTPTSYCSHSVLGASAYISTRRKWAPINDVYLISNIKQVCFNWKNSLWRADGRVSGRRHLTNNK